MRYVVITVFLFFVLLPAFSRGETLKIESIYPSRVGTLSVEKNAFLATDGISNVGIGTTGPGEKLSVAGNVMVGDTTWVAGTTTGDLAIQGNVGIGTTSPSVKLDVNGKISMQDTVNGDGRNIVATKGYVDDVKAELISLKTQVANLESSVSNLPMYVPPENLFNRVHNIDQCEGIGGSVVIDGSNKFCRFSGSSCPASWIKYGQWSTTAAKTATYTVPTITGKCTEGCHPRKEIQDYIEHCGTEKRVCSSGNHNWGNAAVEENTCNPSPEHTTGQARFAPFDCESGFELVTCLKGWGEVCWGSGAKVKATMTEIGCY